MADIKLVNENDIQRKLFQAWVKEAVQLNEGRATQQDNSA